MAEDLGKLPKADAIVLTSPDGTLARLAAADLAGSNSAPVMVAAGGTQAWAAAGLPLETGTTHMASCLASAPMRQIG
jgi:rhodanese-related sulfurtransferase